MEQAVSVVDDFNSISPAAKDVLVTFWRLATSARRAVLDENGQPTCRLISPEYLRNPREPTIYAELFEEDIWYREEAESYAVVMRELETLELIKTKPGQIRLEESLVRYARWDGKVVYLQVVKDAATNRDAIRISLDGVLFSRLSAACSEIHDLGFNRIGYSLTEKGRRVANHLATPLFPIEDYASWFNWFMTHGLGSVKSDGKHFREQDAWFLRLAASQVKPSKEPASHGARFWTITLKATIQDGPHGNLTIPFEAYEALAQAVGKELPTDQMKHDAAMILLAACEALVKWIELAIRKDGNGRSYVRDGLRRYKALYKAIQRAYAELPVRATDEAALSLIESV